MSDEKLEEILRVSKEILVWQKIANDSKVKPLLESILDEPKKIVAYYHSDGEKTTRDLSSLCNAGTGTISRWWTTWINRGIAIPIPQGSGNRAKRMFDPSDYDIAIPNISETGDKNE